MNKKTTQCECSIVESVGEEVTSLKEGDLVIPTYVGVCGECENCLSGSSNLCRKHPLIHNGLMPDGTSRMSAKGQRLSTICLAALHGLSTWLPLPTTLSRLIPGLLWLMLASSLVASQLVMGQLGRRPRLRRARASRFRVLVLLD